MAPSSRRPRGSRDPGHGQRRAGAGWDKGLGDPRGAEATSPCAAPARREPSLPWGVLQLPGSPDWYFSLDALAFFQSRRFPRWPGGTPGALARRLCQVGVLWGQRHRGRHGEATGGREMEQPRSPVPTPRRRLPWGQEKRLHCKCGGEKTMRNVKFPHKNRLAGWETCRILLEHWPGPHETGDRLT